MYRTSSGLLQTDDDLTVFGEQTRWSFADSKHSNSARTVRQHYRRSNECQSAANYCAAERSHYWPAESAHASVQPATGLQTQLNNTQPKPPSHHCKRFTLLHPQRVRMGCCSSDGRHTQPKAWTAATGFSGLWQLSGGVHSCAPTCLGFAINGAVAGCAVTSGVSVVRFLNAGDTVVSNVFVSAAGTLCYVSEVTCFYRKY